MKGRTFKVGNTTIIVRETTPREEDIRKFYDICNELFAGRPECFYTREETREKNKLLENNNKKEAII